MLIYTIFYYREKLPVMVWYHGGAFLKGFSNKYDCEELALFGKVIIVTSNYRLGSLGFLSTGDDNIPGNCALYDQVAVLHWVNSNIENFGGDVNRITVFGQSAGAASVSHLVLSSKANDLFQKAILISRSANSYYGVTSMAPGSARSLAITFGCLPFPTSTMVRCLREKDPYLVYLISLVVPTVLRQIPPNWIPMVDGDLIKDHPRNLMEAGYNSHMDIIVGSAYHDAATFHFQTSM